MPNQLYEMVAFVPTSRCILRGRNTVAGTVTLVCSPLFNQIRSAVRAWGCEFETATDV